MLTLYMICGLPGSGKSTLGEELAAELYEADQYFLDTDGSYRFDPSLLGEAHKWCQQQVECALARGHARLLFADTDVAVANTFSQRWEMEPYLAMAEKYGARLVVIDLFDAGLTDEDLYERNVHGVPLHVIRNMRARWHHDWRNGR